MFRSTPVLLPTPYLIYLTGLPALDGREVQQYLRIPRSTLVLKVMMGFNLIGHRDATCTSGKSASDSTLSARKRDTEVH